MKFRTAFNNCYNLAFYAVTFLTILSLWFNLLILVVSETILFSNWLIVIIISFTGIIASSLLTRKTIHLLLKHF